MRWLAALMVVSGTVVGWGGALEFRYFGSGTPQFTAGLCVVPAGVLSIVAGLMLWTRGAQAKSAVIAGAAALLAGTVAATALDVMGPPATMVGTVGGVVPLVWALRRSGRRHDTRRHS